MFGLAAQHRLVSGLGCLTWLLSIGRFHVEAAWPETGCLQAMARPKSMVSDGQLLQTGQQDRQACLAN